MQRLPHLTADQQFLRTLFHGYLTGSKPLESFVTWVVTGVAAIIGLLVSNADSVAQIISQGCFRWGMILLVISLLPGVASKNFGMAIQQGLATVNAINEQFFSPEGLQVMRAMTFTVEQLQRELLEPIPWPFKWYARKQFSAAQTDYLSAEKLYLKLWRIQFYCGLALFLLAGTGLLVLVLGI